MSEGQRNGLPPGWTASSIGDLCEFNPKHGRDTPDDLPVSFVPMAAVSEVTGRIESAEVRPYGDVKKGFTHFAEGDVIWAKITPCMENGKAAVAEALTNGIACGSTEFMVFRSQGGVEPVYLHRFMRQESYRQAARKTMQSGVGQARVPKDFVLESELPVAPLNEQKRIVAKIEALQLRSSAAKEALDAIGPLLEKFRQSVLAAAFRGDLTKKWREAHPNTEPATELLARIRAERRRRWEATNPKKKYVEPEPVDTEGLPELPEGWCWASLDELCVAVADCPHSTPKWTEEGVVCLRTTEFRPGWLDLTNASYVSEDTYRERTARMVPTEGDVVYSREGGILGIACIVPHEPKMCMGQRMMAMRPSEFVSGAMIMHRLNSPEIVERVTRLTGGSASPHLNVRDIKAFPVPVPPAREQAILVTVVEEALGRVREQASSTKIVRTSLNQMNQSILAKAFRGELVPQDPGDEPASKLLDRIRQEREAGGDKPSRRRGA